MLLLLLLHMLLLSQMIHLCSLIWGIFHNGQRPDGAMLSMFLFFLSSVMKLDCMFPDNVVNGFFWCTTLSSLLNRENAENVSSTQYTS
jgi:hypothetical protein